jgi:murein tripeptide amidase MpaA
MNKGLLITLVLWLVLSLSGWAQQMDYSGYQVLRVFTQNQQEQQFVLDTVQDVWSHTLRDGFVDVCVSPAERAKLLERGLPYKVLMPDVGEVIRQQATQIAPAGGDMFDRYLDYDEVVQEMRNMERRMPQIARVFVLGQSLQGRTIYGLRITNNVRRERIYPNRYGVVFNGCQHAREWITVSMNLYIARMLVDGYGVDSRITDIVNNTEIYILPVINPDGYVYTWTTNRLWRKNRRYNGIVQGQPSYGVDLNRNWAYQWGGEGASNNPRSETYRGTAAFSEPETLRYSLWLRNLPNLKAHIDFHSYSQLILWPWGYTSNLCPDHDTFNAVGTQMQSLIQSVHGMYYEPGPIYTTIYPASGGAVDWAYGAKRALSFTIELRDQGQFGFLLPPEQIRPTSEENWAAVLSMLEWARKRTVF